MKLEPHPFLKGLPMMPSHEIDALAADIKKHGQRVPIMLYGGKILDGRNRYEACLRLKIEPRTAQFTKAKPKEYVISANYFRKHWTISERAHFAALMSMESEIGRPKPVENGAEPPVTQAQAAKIMGVSRDSVKRAKAKIKEKTNENKSGSGHTGSETKGDSDASGKTIPASALPYWNRKAEAKQVLAQISAARGQVKRLIPDDPMWSAVNLNGVIADLNSAFNRFAAAVPAYVCPVCSGKKPDGCKCCKGKGVISEFVWKQVPEELKNDA